MRRGWAGGVRAPRGRSLGAPPRGGGGAVSGKTVQSPAPFRILMV